MLSRIPHEEHDEVMLKAAAFDCLGGKRKNWALQTRWHGNYLAKVRLAAEYPWNATQLCNVGTMLQTFKTMSRQYCDAVTLKIVVANRLVLHHLEKPSG